MKPLTFSQVQAHAMTALTGKTDTERRLAMSIILTEVKRLYSKSEQRDE